MGFLLRLVPSVPGFRSWPRRRAWPRAWRSAAPGRTVTSAARFGCPLPGSSRSM